MFNDLSLLHTLDSSLPNSLHARAAHAKGKPI